MTGLGVRMCFPGVLKEGWMGIGYFKEFLSIYLDYVMQLYFQEFLANVVDPGTLVCCTI